VQAAIDSGKFEIQLRSRFAEQKEFIQACDGLSFSESQFELPIGSAIGAPAGEPPTAGPGEPPPPPGMPAQPPCSPPEATTSQTPGGVPPPQSFQPPPNDAAKSLTVILVGGPFAPIGARPVEELRQAYEHRSEMVRKTAETLGEL